jgi:hypothetical protein
VLIAAVISGFVFRAEGGGGWRIAVAAALAWAGLIAIDAVSGPVRVVGAKVAGVIGVPSAVLVLVTLVFPALLAWSAATLVSAVLRRRIAKQR